MFEGLSVNKVDDSLKIFQYSFSHLVYVYAIFSLTRSSRHVVSWEGSRDNPAHKAILLRRLVVTQRPKTPLFLIC